MVIALLLADATKPLRYQDLGRVALQCLQGVHSMWKALSIFQSALPHGSEPPSTTTSPTSSSRLLSAFDAQVGDCACQIRPQMLWELVQFYTTPEKQETLHRAVALLQEIKIKASFFLQEVEQTGTRRCVRKLSALRTHLSVWQHIGFTRFLDLFHRPSNTGAQLQSMPSPRSSHRHRQITVETEWDAGDLFLTARFLTFCFLLSESKMVKVESGPPIRMTVRVELQVMYEEIGRDLEAQGLLQAQSDALKYCNGKGKMNTHCEVMQTYVSIITTDWMRSAALRLGLFDLHQSLSQGMVVASRRRVLCVAAYASMLLLRTVWLTFDTPLLVAIQRFCSHGEFHDVYCRVIRNPAEQAPSASSLCEIGESSWFNVTLVSTQDIIASPWAKQPHIILRSMSGEGTVGDFRRLFLDSEGEKLCRSQPDNPTCGEIADYISKLEGVNFARLLAHFFAHHDQFPFTLPDKEGTIERLFRESLGKRAGDVFEMAKNGAYVFGTGRSVDMFTPEHIFLEFPAVALRGLMEKPVLYGCKLESGIDSHFQSVS